MDKSHLRCSDASFSPSEFNTPAFSKCPRLYLVCSNLPQKCPHTFRLSGLQLAPNYQDTSKPQIETHNHDKPPKKTRQTPLALQILWDPVGDLHTSTTNEKVPASYTFNKHLLIFNNGCRLPNPRKIRPATRLVACHFGPCCICCCAQAMGSRQAHFSSHQRFIQGGGEVRPGLLGQAS